MTASVQITHPFHPLLGQTIDFAERRAYWGEDRVFFRSCEGHLTSVPTGWTSLAPEDPFVVFSRGRSRFRFDDLVQLVSLIAEVQS